jgi:methyl-accepting chemotaxis protein
MDEMTQQNAALVEQAAAAAQSMQDQSVKLGQAVAVFKLGLSSEPAVHHARPTAIPVVKKKLLPNIAASPKLASAKAKRSGAGTDGNDEWEEF